MRRVKTNKLTVLQCKPAHAGLLSSLAGLGPRAPAGQALEPASALIASPHGLLSVGRVPLHVTWAAPGGARGRRPAVGCALRLARAACRALGQCPLAAAAALQRTRARRRCGLPPALRLLLAAALLRRLLVLPSCSCASAPSSPQEHREKEGRNKNENRIFELKFLQNTMNRNEIQAVSLQPQELIDRKEFRQKIE